MKRNEILLKQKLIVIIHILFIISFENNDLTVMNTVR